MISVKINVDTGVIMQKISFLLLGTSLSFLPQTLSAAECAVTDCSLLGYTDSACPGSGLKCPFGEGWYCGGGAAEDCIKLGFIYGCTGTGYAGGVGETCNGKYQSCTCSSPYTWSGSACSCPSTYQYTCSGTGYSGGSGSACGGKYTACTCSGGYEWKDGSCQKQVLNGAQGELYYCNGTVVGVKAGDMNFYVAMNDLRKMNWTNAYNQCSSYVFCGNFKGTLPDRDQLLSIYNNKSQVNTLLSANGGTQFTNSTNNCYWSSHPSGSNYYYTVDIYNGYVESRKVDLSYYVRPVLTFW